MAFRQVACRSATGRLLLLIFATLALLLVANCVNAAGSQPLVFLGDSDLPPYEFLSGGEPKGANVDLVRAIGAVLGRPVEIRLKPWGEAQKSLLAGEGHALTLLGKTEEREAKFDFSAPTMPVAFALFVRVGDEARFRSASLEGKRIGVISGGLPESHFATHHPQAIRVTVSNGTEGIRHLLRGDIDALAAHLWSQSYLLNELNISGITSLDPFVRRLGNIAVRDGDAELLEQIDLALRTLKENGELDRIIDRWSSGRVHLLSDRTMRFLIFSALAVTLLLALLIAATIRLRSQKAALAREIEDRKRVEFERERAADALRVSERQLQDADRRKDEFLATLAHELRNPLAPIRNAVEIQRLSNDPQVQRRAHEIIERQVNQLVHLVDDLLDVSRIVTGKVALRKRIIDVTEAITNAVETSQPVIERSRHRLKVDIAPGPMLVEADLTRLTQVIANLLNNSAKYTPEHGNIRVAAWRQESNILVAISDNGVGIPAEMLPHVFDMFSQVDQSLDRSHGGLGIGLSLVRKLVELHDGAVEAQSEGVGRGATFTISLPAASGIPVDTPNPHHPQNKVESVRRVRLIVVDDNIDNAETVKALLELMEYEVAVAHDGYRAVELADHLRPDAMLIDIGLPGISGHEVAQRLRATPWGSSTALIAMTGWGQPEDRLKSIEAGFDHHLTKPVKLAELREVLERLVKAAEVK